MKTLSWFTNAIGISLMLLASNAFANDTSVGGTGSDLMPLTQTTIRMVSEDIVLSRGHDKMWTVEATYRFANPSDQKIAVQMGFPETRCSEDEVGECNGDGRFLGLRTTIRGVEVKERVGKISKRHPWAPKLGRVFLYGVAFAPGETVQIVHRYRYAATFNAGNQEYVSYLTTTGAHWNGPIGKARFVVRTLFRPWAIDYPLGITLTSNIERVLPDGDSQTELVFAVEEWTPKVNFQVTLDSDSNGMSYDSPCPIHLQFFDRPFSEGLASVTRDQLRQLSVDDMRICRNLPYALHGMPFKDPGLRRIFYRAATSNSGKETTRTGFVENPSFSDALLSPDERGWITVFDDEAKHRGLSALAQASSASPDGGTKNATSSDRRNGNSSSH